MPSTRPTPNATDHIRIATLNVHGWHNEHNRSGSSRLELLCKRDGGPPDVIALQEATKHRVPELAQALGGYYWIACRNCAILSKRPILASMPGATSGHGRKATGSSGKHDGSCQVRHCAGVVTCADGTPIEVVCLHLDHVRETTRLGQLRDLLEHLEERPNIPPLLHRVLLGDFNALTRSDYSEAEWRQVADVRARNAWEAPVSVVTDTMGRSPTKKAPLGLHMHDAWTTVSAAKRIGPLSTCRFDTRIDYIFVTASLAGALVDAECAVAIPHASDHNLVVARLDLSKLIERRGPGPDRVRATETAKNKSCVPVCGDTL